MRRDARKKNKRGGMESIQGGTMPSYEICYLDNDGSLSCTFSAECANETHAKVLAHAMKLSACRKFEVWQELRLVYERPQHFEPEPALY
jgi:hypothetical protein